MAASAFFLLFALFLTNPLLTLLLGGLIFVFGSWFVVRP